MLCLPYLRTLTKPQLVPPGQLYKDLTAEVDTFIQVQLLCLCCMVSPPTQCLGIISYYYHSVCSDPSSLS